MCDGDHQSCREHEALTRRRFVGMSAGLMASALAPSWLPGVVHADSGESARDVIVTLFLRGGADGLSMVVPHGDPSYYELRPTLAVPPPDSSARGRVGDLDGFFGLAPAFEPLRHAWDDGALLLVHACGLDGASRSHFEAMRSVEMGGRGSAPVRETGWLGRHLRVTAPVVAGGAPRAVGIGYGLQRTLAGAPFERGAGTVELLRRIGFGSYRPAGGAVYPEDELGYALRSAAALIRAEVGVEAVAIDIGGWDTHELQAPLDGHMHYLMSSFAGALAAFHADLAAAGVDRVSLVAMSEFGREARENGSLGTDHGHGGLMLALGSGIAGGRVLADWPGLAPEDLHEGRDLAITTDYRDVLAEILERRAGNANWRTVFPDPGYSRRVLGVTV